MFFSGFILSSVSRSVQRQHGERTLRPGVFSNVTTPPPHSVSSSRCFGQHGEVQHPGSLQLQHADAVRPRAGSVRGSAGGVVRPGPQRHQQTATASGNAHRAPNALFSSLNVNVGRIHTMPPLTNKPLKSPTQSEKAFVGM